MASYAIDEQVTVDLEQDRDGFHPTSVHVFIPGHTQTVSVSRELQGRSFQTGADAAESALAELRAAQPDLLAHWTTREGFF